MENNLDIAIARYNLPIADMDILRPKAGGVFRGVNAGVVQGTPGGGVGEFPTGAPGAGAGGTNHRWCRGRGRRRIRSRTIYVGRGHTRASYDPAITTLVILSDVSRALREEEPKGHSLRRCAVAVPRAALGSDASPRIHGGVQNRFHAG